MAPEDKAVMGQTNKSMARRLTISVDGNTVMPWENLRGDARFRFLCAIEGQYQPHLIPCPLCVVLHPAYQCFMSAGHVACPRAHIFMGRHHPLCGQDLTVSF